MIRNSSGLLKQNSSSLELIQRMLDVGVIFIAMIMAVAFRHIELSADYMLVAILSVFVFEVLSAIRGVYRSWRMETLLAEISSVVGVWAITVLILLMVGFASKTSAEFSRVTISTWALLVLVGLAGLRVLYRALLRGLRSEGLNTRNVAFAGYGKAAKKMSHHITTQPWMGLKVLGVFDDRSLARLGTQELPLMGDLKEMVAKARAGEIDLVYIALPMHAEKRIVQLIDELADTTASVFVVPDIFVFELFHAKWSTVGEMPVVSVFDSPFYGINGGVKRIEDIVFGSLILLMILPVMLVIALGIKFTSPGSVLFKQRRYGLKGEIVEVWKFRSMTVSDNGDKVVQATKGDARITPFGAFLRRTSLDELPQFFNVLQGRMSIVGPRPHAVAHNEEYRKLLHGYMLRHQVKPGITGWAQVNGWRGETDTLDKMKGRLDCDLFYVRNWSLWLDVKIIFMTVFKGFVGKNVY
ncbi:MAG: undecaprenyl-phosphate glucose phosphotransferase [Sideroxydans sp.]|nr:undecaprenyl-phosphate glucose phosphotransferase [Sideroxydans sp.]